MDTVLVRFRELNASQTGNSPPDVVNRLLDQCSVRVVQEPLRVVDSSGSGASVMYSITIYIADTPFVAMDRLKKKATNKAWAQVYEFLEMESAKHDIENNENMILDDKSNGFSSKKNCIQMEEQQLAINLDRDHSSILDSGPAEQIPHLPQDQKLQQILAAFKTIGHQASYQNYHDGHTYCSIIAIEGFKKFVGHSIKSNSESLRNACEDLKNCYVQTFGEPFGPSQSLQNMINLINPEDDHRNAFPLVEQVNQLSLPPTPISSQMVNMCTPTLSPCDLKWIELINQFNSVYDSNKSPISNMEDLIAKDSNAFKISNSFHISEDQENNYVTMVKHDNLGTFYGVDMNSSKSRLKALAQPFQYLLKLSGLFSSFNLLYQSNDGFQMPLMDAFIALNSETVTVKVLPVSKLFYKASITVGQLKHFDALGDTEEQAQCEAFGLLVEYCKLYSARIQPPQSNKNNPLFNRFNSQKSGVSKSSRQGYSYYQGRAGSPNLPALPSSMCNKLMQLISNFNKVYKYGQPFQTVMDDLISLDHEVFHFETKRTYNRKGDRMYETKVSFMSAIFTGNADTRPDSRNNALYAVYKRLLDISGLFRYFRKEYYPGMSVTKLKDFKLQIVTHYEVVLKLKVRPRGQLGYQATFSLVHFCDFHGDSKVEEESEIIAFRKLIDYMLLLIANISKSQEELEMEAKQVAPFLPNENDNSPMPNNSAVSFGSASDLQTPITPRVRHSSGILKNISSHTPNLAPDPSISTFSDSANVDYKIQKMIELVNDFKQVDLAGVAPLDAIQKLNESHTSGIMMTTNLSGDSSYITAVQLRNIATFYSCMEQQEDSERYAAHSAVDFIRNVMKLVVDFNSFYSQQFEALEIVDKLRQASAITIKLNTFIINGAKRLPNKLYCSTLQLSNMVSFSRTKNEEVASKNAVATDLIQYLRKLANGIN